MHCSRYSMLRSDENIENQASNTSSKDNVGESICLTCTYSRGNRSDTRLPAKLNRYHSMIPHFIPLCASLKVSQHRPRHLQKGLHQTHRCGHSCREKGLCIALFSFEPSQGQEVLASSRQHTHAFKKLFTAIMFCHLGSNREICSMGYDGPLPFGRLYVPMHLIQVGT